MGKDFDILIEKIRRFNKERGWDRFHNPKDILIALVSEVGELAECYRWLEEKEIDDIKKDLSKKKIIEEEIADILVYLLILCDKSNIDIVKAVNEKIEKNSKRYPVDKIKGKHTNFLQGHKAK